MKSEPYRIQPGDYAQFTRIVAPAEKMKIRGAGNSNHDCVVKEREIIDQGGSGLVLSVSKNAAKIGDEKVMTGRVDAGPLLKVVTAILDDAILVGKQQQMDLGLFDTDAAPSMYGTDSKGHQ